MTFPALALEPESLILLNPEQAARCLGVRRRTIVDWARRGILPCVVYKRGKDGRATMIAFDPIDLDAFIEKHRREGRR